MSTREEWLALGAEPPLEPGLPICDPHHHLWVYPESRYLVEDFLADTGGGHRITRTVHVECLMFYRDAPPEALRPVGDTEHIDRITASTQERDTRVAAGIVGFADLRLGEAVQPVLEAHAAASTRLRGVRFGTAWDPSERIHSSHTKPSPGLLLDPVFTPCVEVSPTQPIHRENPDTVTIASMKCIGCQLCSLACPFGAIWFDALNKVSRKCDRCLVRLERGEEPACVTTCSARALHFGELNEMIEIAKGRGLHTMVTRASGEYGTLVSIPTTWNGKGS